MTSLLTTRRRAAEFAAAVDRVPAAAAPPAELASLVEVVQVLRAHAPVAPREEFASELRARLVREAETCLSSDSARLALPEVRRGPRERRLVAAACAFVLVGGSTTMAAAAQSALPGDPLYVLKRGIEQAEAGLRVSDAGKGSALLGQAEQRLAEVEQLLVADPAPSAGRVSETLTAFTSSAGEGSALLFDAYRESGDPDNVVAVREFAARGMSAVQTLAPVVPADSQDELGEAAFLLHQIDEQAASLCSGCAADLPLVQVPGIFLARADADQALTRAGLLDLTNDHPVVVDRDLVEEVRSGQLGAEAPTSGGSAAGDADAPAAAVPSAPLETDAWPSLLPEVGGDVTGGTTSGGTTSGGTSAGSTTGATDLNLDGTIGGAVETLLPDTGDLLP